MICDNYDNCDYLDPNQELGKIEHIIMGKSGLCPCKLLWKYLSENTQNKTVLLYGPNH